MPFLGMRGTGDWGPNIRPENWRQKLLRLYPNGAAPLTAIMSMMSSEKTSDPHFHWFTKMLADQRSTITGRYTDQALSANYTGGGVAGDVLYLKMAEAEIDKYGTTHQVLLRASADLTVDVNAKVVGRNKNGNNSYLKVRLLEDDDNSSTHSLVDADTCLIVGTINPEGARAPGSIMYDPVEWENYTQIFRTPLEHTRTAIKTQLRTEANVKEAKREALELHGVEMEKAFIFGVRSINTGDNGKPERTTAGIKSFITSNRFDFKADGGGTWKANGEDWLDEKLEQVFRFGAQEKLALCGSGALLAVNRVAKIGGNIQLTVKSKSYGIQVLEWVTAFGVLNLKMHPLFNYEPTLRNAMLIVEPRLLTYRYIDDTRYKPNIGENDLDGEKSEYLTEAGLEVHFEQCHGWIDNMGLDA